MDKTMNESMYKPKVNIIAIREKLEKEYNFDHDQAEGIAIVMNDAMQMQDTTGFATKEDLLDVKSELKPDIQLVRRDLQEVKSELKHDIQELRQELKSEIQEVKSELKTDILKLELKVDAIMDKLTIRVGVMIVGALGLIKTAQSLGWW